MVMVIPMVMVMVIIMITISMTMITSYYLLGWSWLKKDGHW